MKHKEVKIIIKKFDESKNNKNITNLCFSSGKEEYHGSDKKLYIFINNKLIKIYPTVEENEKNIKYEAEYQCVKNEYLHREDGPAIVYGLNSENEPFASFYYWKGEFLHDCQSQKEFEMWKKFRNFI